MRKLLAIAAAAAVATVAFGAAPAQAQCPLGDGTVPGTGSREVAIGAPGKTLLYIDDRDYPDLDDDGKSGGIWIYQESNNRADLQRGGDQIIFEVLRDNGVNPTVPRVTPIVTPLPSPTRPGQPFTLFPEGFGGESLAQLAGSHDDCKESTTPDNVLF